MRKNICRLLPAFAGTGLGAVTKPSQELSVVFEIDAQHDRDAEDELAMGEGIEVVVGNTIPELNTPLNPPSMGDQGG
jgi:hypothetical protein